MYHVIVFWKAMLTGWLSCPCVCFKRVASYQEKLILLAWQRDSTWIQTYGRHVLNKSIRTPLVLQILFWESWLHHLCTLKNLHLLCLLACNIWNLDTPRGSFWVLMVLLHAVMLACFMKLTMILGNKRSINWVVDHFFQAHSVGCVSYDSQFWTESFSLSQCLKKKSGHQPHFSWNWTQVSDPCIFSVEKHLDS